MMELKIADPIPDEAVAASREIAAILDRHGIKHMKADISVGFNQRVTIDWHWGRHGADRFKLHIAFTRQVIETMTSEWSDKDNRRVAVHPITEPQEEPGT